MRKTVFLLKWAALTGSFMLLTLSLVGCGIKGPPVPPKAPPVPVVADLSYQVEGGLVVLTWRLPEQLSRRQAEGSAFAIYQSRTELAEAACEGCPLVFEKVATLPYVHAEDSRFSITLALDPGYRYAFKVRLENNAQAGPDADPIRFDFPSDGSFAPTETP